MTPIRRPPRQADLAAPPPSGTLTFKGNKASLPAKECAACGRPMTWRKRWARTWNEVKYCSDACRKAGTPARRT